MVSWKASVGLLLGVGSIAVASVGIAAQAPPAKSVCPMDAHAEFHRCALAAAKSFSPQSRVDGKPDLSGIWRRRATAHESVEAHPPTDDDRGGPSTIVDPVDGRVPYQAWALQRLPGHVERHMHQNAACLVSGVPTGMYQGNVSQIVHSPARVVFLSQEAHAWRLVPLDGAPFLPPEIRLWRGDSRGTWDGNSLVVSTRNQTGLQWLDQRGRFLTSDVVVEERFTMIDQNTIHYAATVQDPNVLTRPFTMAMALRRDLNPGAEITEEACYESNGLLMAQLAELGLSLFPGITPEQAREAARAAGSAQGPTQKGRK